jgi:hypothetical protein
VSADLEDFVTGVLTHKGGLVESCNEGSCEVLLPGHIARSLGMSEYAALAFRRDDPRPDTIFITYGSSILEEVAALLGEEGRAAAIAFPDRYVKSGDFEREAERAYMFPRARWNLIGVSRERIPYAILNFHYTAVSDERLDGSMSIAVNEATLSCPEGFLEELEKVLLFKEEADLSEDLTSKPLEKVYEKACSLVRYSLAESLREFTKSMNVRLQRDTKRLHEYYRGIIDSLLRKGRGPKKTGEEEKSSRRDAARLEFRAKVAELREKYSVRVGVRLVSACRVILPAVRCSFKAEYKTSSAVMEVCWNSLTKSMEPVSCSACGRDTYRILICGNLHFTCPDCGPVCPICGLKKTS